MAVCVWRFAGGLRAVWGRLAGGLRLEVCAWRFASGGLRLAVCAWRFAPGGLRLAVWLGGWRLAVCRRFAVGGLRGDCWRFCGQIAGGFVGGLLAILRAVCGLGTVLRAVYGWPFEGGLRSVCGRFAGGLRAVCGRIAVGGLELAVLRLAVSGLRLRLT